ncbi:MAG: UDP-N-acetylmuramate:L-alanyl-gamma-D-glutamyl-meso-diaminopimelate ligase [candidate division KSB1 bacterium]|nr:UDP-N-acetylmuramate:L-alanyl-gamma-D-glutamyl-meso-diaminopimelate ligase [candidate division KSB1 bacterium]MDZ7288166.1 UDP-N-acetylmuramate:L-alanyl-gamma-D-glutamyl-meso-diaminopimelate ligase [candidate division KSB1 bacterium]MDZ7300321.1 UDP-N-acetylmuramate:L-alanyl-gamma-D-glutamyl-meso-diaminopimelate ligase [candidate division KSB1 bacterium]MDZ7308673.1 UDP-N-acetylmuramate:L-alanyl-gamma-D-glutamyl-meso-diaminopimelate ligase [candidate division KSB1 bacterium]MDZ7351321.1 UDP-
MSQRIHLIAICGTGMAALAGMLKERGCEVTGSDENIYPPMSTFLQEKGIPVMSPFAAKNLQPAPDLVVVGNAMSRGNPEVEHVLNEQLRYVSLPEMLREYFIRGKYSCVVAGTHGKTTTTSLLAWSLYHAGQDPGFFIGGIPENFGQGYRLGRGRHFVLEGDEYDTAFFDKRPKFLHYLPNLVILNNVEFDHADIYRNLDEVQLAFQRLLNLIPGNGFLIANQDDAIVRTLAGRAFCKVITFGLSEPADWRAGDIRTRTQGVEFTVLHAGSARARAWLPLAGEHNVRNALAVLAAGEVLGLPLEQRLAALASFRGVQRRLQLRLDDGKHLIYDDFAHHPTAVKATIAGLRQRHPGRRLWAVFEPRTASTKRKVFEQDYIAAFAAADHVVFAPLHRADKVPEAERLSLPAVIAGLRAQGKPVDLVPAGSEMANFIARQLQAGDVVLFMSNGDFGGTPALLASRLQSAAAANHAAGQDG